MDGPAGRVISRRAACLAVAMGVLVIGGWAPGLPAQDDASPRMPSRGRRYLQQRQLEEQERQRRWAEERQQTWQEDRRRQRLRDQSPREEAQPRQIGRARRGQPQ